MPPTLSLTGETDISVGGAQKPLVVGQIVERDLGVSVKDVTRITQGEQNAVFRVDAAQNRYTVRMGGDGVDSYRKEQWAITHAAEIGVPVAKVHAVGVQDDTPYILMDWIEGIPGNVYTGDKHDLYETLGSYAQKIAKIPVSGYGWDFKPDPTPHFTQIWREAVEKDKAYIFSGGTLAALDLLDEVHTKMVCGFMQDYALWDLPAALSHNDICLDNVIIGNDDTVYLIDWSNICAQPAPAFEIARVGSSIAGDLLASFVKGYGIKETEWQAMAPTVEKLKLVHALRAVVWAARDAPAYLDDFSVTVRSLAKTWPT